MNIVLVAIYWLLNVISTLLVIRAICTWFPQIRQSKFYDVLFQLTEPILSPIRDLLNKLKIGNGMFDFSLIAAYIIIMILQALITRI